MNQLKYFTPLSFIPRLQIEDLELLQNSYLDGFKAFSQVINASAYILAGCELTTVSSGPDVCNMSAGYIVINGEILKFESTNFTTDVATLVDDYKFAIDEAVMAPSPVEHKDLVLRNIHFSRKAKVVVDSPHDAVLCLSNMYRYIDLLFETQLHSAVPITLTSPWVNGSNPTNNPHYRIEGKRVYLEGDIRHTGTVGATNTPFFTLPSAIRPPQTRMFSALASRGWDATNKKITNILADPRSAYVLIEPGGACYADHACPTSIVLDGISWYL